MRSCLYSGTVVHRRLRPVLHEFRYDISTFALDLDELPALDRRSRLFAVNRRGAIAFHDRDHLDGAAGATKTKVERFLARHGVESGGPIVLVTQCRMLGYVFNPVSFFYCHAASGALSAIVVEVNNTFGERHLYLLDERTRIDASETLRHRCAKRMHVSPFLAMDAAYRFHFAPLGEHLTVAIAEEEEGATRLETAIHGKRQPLDTRALARLAALRPLATVKITAAIHWQALRLWRRHVPLFRQPPPSTAQLAQHRLLHSIGEEVRS